jgi:hypothetical protein
MHASWRLFSRKAGALAFVGAASAWPLAATHAAASFEIINLNVAGVGFNDTTPASPVGGNPGTSLGEQRLIAFTYATNLWGASLSSAVPIRVRAQFTALPCTATTATLGNGAAIEVFRNFANAPFADTWYTKAEANSLATVDLDPTNADINASFNDDLGESGCLSGTPFYLGLDNNHGSSIDFVTVAMHELAHGLGVQTNTSSSTGSYLNGTPNIYDYFLHDDTTNKDWIQMTNAERAASAINFRHVTWTGPNVLAAAPAVLAWGYPRMTISAPESLAGVYEVGTAPFGPALTRSGVSANVAVALDPSDVAGSSTTDACSPISNPVDVAGHIAFVDDGHCAVTTKVKNAQDAGAVAVIVGAVTTGTTPPVMDGSDASIVIPTVSVSIAEGGAIKATRAAALDVAATLNVDNHRLAGANASGQPLMYTPNPRITNATISHFDTGATPNLLMEPPPYTYGDIGQSVFPPQDLTLALLRDIGWKTTSYTVTADRIFIGDFD